MAETIPPRRDVKLALRAVGLSDRQTRALLRGGWRALVGESQAEVDELLDELRQQRDLLSQSVGGK